MALELNVGDDRTYTKVDEPRISYTIGICTVPVILRRNVLVNNESIVSFDIPSSKKLTVDEAYEAIKVLPDFEGYFDC